MKHPFPQGPCRRGFSFLELQVSLILLGIALVGLVPLVVIQSRQLEALEYRWDPDWEASQAEEDFWIDHYRVEPDGPVYDLVPPSVAGCTQANPWARKLGASARLVPRAESDSPESAIAGGWADDIRKNTVVITGGTVHVGVSSSSATVVVTPIPSEPEVP